MISEDIPLLRHRWKLSDLRVRQRLSSPVRQYYCFRSESDSDFLLGNAKIITLCISLNNAVGSLSCGENFTTGKELN